mmetsp:Transcript_141047/g.316255  ORF Transcript_141047/g.316255 Transcript_141047/m.316255 type:complete len:1411 (-) Transcript_141047:296-4528(-)
MRSLLIVAVGTTAQPGFPSAPSTPPCFSDAERRTVLGLDSDFSLDSLVNLEVAAFNYSSHFKAQHVAWRSAELSAEVMLIILKEIMGVNASYDLDSRSTSIDSMRAVVGCPGAGNTCEEGIGEGYNEMGFLGGPHVAVELWYNNILGSLSKLLDSATLEYKPHVAGFMGYLGREGMFISQQRALEEAEEQNRVLQWFEGLSDELGSAAEYFDGIEEILAASEPEGFQPCSEASWFVSGAEAYHKHLNDVDPEGTLVDGDGKVQANCDIHPSGAVWVNKLAREKKAAGVAKWCVPLLTSSGYGVQFFLSQSTMWDMPVCVLNYKWGHYVTQGKQWKALMYWWWPDPTFEENRPVQIVGLPQDKLQHADLNYYTPADNTPVATLSNPILNLDPDLGVPIYLFLKQYRIENRDMLVMLQELIAGATVRDAACTWLRSGNFANMPRVLGWVPKNCAPGEAVMAGSCEACPEGYFSLGGYVTSCTQCFPGTFQNTTGNSACHPCPAGTLGELPAQASCDEPCPPGTASIRGSSRCTACQPGTFSDVERQGECGQCAPGRFQNETGQTDCKVCPVGTAAASGEAECEACAPGKFSDVPEAPTCTLCPQGEHQDHPGSSECVACDPGTFAASRGSEGCDPCRAGAFSTGAGSTRCLSCESGLYQDEEGQTGCLRCGGGNYTASPAWCQACPPGEYRRDNDTRFDECVQCPAGFFSPGGEEACEPCPAGQHSPAPGGVECLPCPEGQASKGASPFCSPCAVGTYSKTPGSSECEVCDFPHGTTLESGWFRSPSACVCDEGFFTDWEAMDQWRAAQAAGGCGAGEGLRDGLCEEVKVCWECPLQCNCTERNRTYPGQLAGFYLREQGLEWTTFECTSDACISSDDPTAARCGDNFADESLTCAECKTGFFLFKFSCAACKEPRAMPLMLGLTLMACAMCATYYCSNSPVTRDASSLMTTTVSFGLMLTAAQSLSIMATLNVEWPEPWKTIINAMALASFDIEGLQLACLTKPAPLRAYVVRVSVPMMALGGFAAMWAISQVICPVLRKEPWDKAKAANSSGQVWQALYISIALVALLPFQCYDHPSGDSSLRAFSHVVCGTDEHTVMFTFGVLFTLLYGVGFFSLCLMANWKAPELSAKYPVFVSYFRFLLFRFRVDRWYWGSVLMVRSFMIALVPILNPNSGNGQVVMLTAVVSTCLVLQCFVMPWKTTNLNKMDTLVLYMLVLLTGAAGVFTEQEEDTQGFLTFMILAFGVTSFILAAVLLGGITSSVKAALGMQSSSAKRTVEKNKEVAASFVVAMKQLSALNAEDVQRVFREFGGFDRRTVKKFLLLVDHELLQGMAQTKAQTTRLTVQKKTGLQGVMEALSKPYRTATGANTITAERVVVPEEDSCSCAGDDDVSPKAGDMADDQSTAPSEYSI